MKNITQYNKYIDKEMNKINLYPKVTLLKTRSGILLFCATDGIGIFSFSLSLFLISNFLFFLLVSFPVLSPSDKLPTVLKVLIRF